MVEVHILGELFLSKVLGIPIVNNTGRWVGRLWDMSVRWDGISPRVTGIKFAKGVQNHIDINQIAEWNEKSLVLKGPLDANNLKQLQEDEIYVGKWLLDKQIIDLKGSKLVRVNDIKLSWVAHEDTSEILLVAVDIGLRGLLRRIGLESLAKNRPMNLVGWQYMSPLQNRTANQQLIGDEYKLAQMHPVDIAEIIESLDHRERTGFLDTLDNQTAAEALAEVDLDTQVEIIQSMDSERASDILEEMGPDEAADILGELTDEKSTELLTLMEPEDAEDVRELMSYPEQTAGALMTTEYISFTASTTAEETINKLRELAPAAETIYYLYVVEAEETLLGVVSLRELIIAQPTASLRDIMINRVVSVNHHDEQDKVLDVVMKYNLLAVPVVDDSNHMMGIITIDDVLETVLPDRSNLETFPHFMGFSRPKWGWKE
ncbi:MAG TPA: CBS domain-containing protein [Bacillota bacterium]|nr:CBS domain-containing protein [Bacillota bacterium]